MTFQFYQKWRLIFSYKYPVVFISYDFLYLKTIAFITAIKRKSNYPHSLLIVAWDTSNDNSINLDHSCSIQLLTLVHNISYKVTNFDFLYSYWTFDLQF